MALDFQSVAGITRLRVLQQDIPWRAIRAFTNTEHEALVHVHNVSGGVLSGDDLSLAVHVGSDARVQLTSTGATRLYRRKSDGRGARQQSAITIQKGGFLEYLPDPVIPFADSEYHQSIAINLEEDAGLIWWEIVSAGRVTSAETFAFQQFTSEFAITALGRPIALERFRLQPDEQELTSLARFGDFLYTAALYTCHVNEDQLRWTSLERKLSLIADELSTPDVRWGASTLVRDGIVVRCLSREAHLIMKGLYRFWAEAKLAIWNRPACIPRKVH